MKRNFYTQLLFYVVFGVSSFSAFTQDIHYSNFGFSPLNINPALTGVFPGDIRANAAYRSQWTDVPVSYTTFTGAADFRLGKLREGKIRHWSVGGIFNYDQAGFSHLNNAQIGVSAAYMLTLSPNAYLSAGLSTSINQRRFTVGDLTWDDQYQNKQFNANITSADVAVFERTHNYMVLTPGVNYHFQKPSGRFAIDVGLGIFNLNRPNVSFNDDPLHKLPIRYSFYAGGNFPIARSFDILIESMLQLQSPHKEFIGGFGGRYYLRTQKTKQIAIQAGFGVRGKDAYTPHLGFLYNQWRVAVNFDRNFSPFQTATNKLGGTEVSLIYIFSRVPLADCKLCPTFL